MKMVERYHYLQCSAEYGLCVKAEAFVCAIVCLFVRLFWFVFVFFLSSKINGIAGFDGLNLFSNVILSELTIFKKNPI
jgi:hypothetical protein